MYLSKESLDAVKRTQLGLWMLVEKKHKVHSTSEVKEVTKITHRVR
jgi:hypothetical protein